MDDERGDINFIDCEDESPDILKGTAMWMMAIMLFIFFYELEAPLVALLYDKQIDSIIYKYTRYISYSTYTLYLVVTMILCIVGIFLSKKNIIFYPFFIAVVLLTAYSFIQI